MGRHEVNTLRKEQLEPKEDNVSFDSHWWYLSLLMSITAMRYYIFVLASKLMFLLPPTRKQSVVIFGKAQSKGWCTLKKRNANATCLLRSVLTYVNCMVTLIPWGSVYSSMAAIVKNYDVFISRQNRLISYYDVTSLRCHGDILCKQIPPP